MVKHIILWKLKVMLYSVFESEEALKEYAINPIHVKVANEKVRPFTETRLCMDFSEI